MLCVYVMYGCMFVCAMGVHVLVCAKSIMSGFSSVYFCLIACSLPFQPFIFWNIIFKICGGCCWMAISSGAPFVGVNYVNKFSL